MYEIKIRIPKKIYEDNQHDIDGLLNEINEVLGRIDKSIEMFEQEVKE